MKKRVDFCVIQLIITVGHFQKFIYLQKKLKKKQS